MSSPIEADDLPLRERKKRQARADILNAARTLFDHRGYRLAKMREIATRANVSYQTLYNYFPTKASLLEAILGEDIEHLSVELEAIARHGRGGLLPTLAAIVEAYMAVVSGTSERELWRIVTVDLLQSGAAAQRFTRLLDQGTQSEFRRLLADARQRGELSSRVDLDVLADTLFSLANSSFVRFLIEPDARAEQTIRNLAAQFDILISPYLEKASGPLAR